MQSATRLRGTVGLAAAITALALGLATPSPADKHNVDQALRARPLMGVQIILDMKPSGTPDKWTGHIYNSDDGKTYRGSIPLPSPTTLKVEGCVMAFCEAEIWTRTE